MRTRWCRLSLSGILPILGVFALTVPEEYGGSGFGKLAMVVVTEELVRGSIGVGVAGGHAAKSRLS
ncbi:MAG: hypothetical protein KatS3mg060_1514 [Dehalococcoidia bacterium]|nr:MAG: hypothetical protein KatS3mg060_1514 [Dehalococcoidia bacterium]